MVDLIRVSDPKLIKRQLGLTTQLADRAARLEWLIQFINENGALYRLNASLRLALATHAEKLAAAQGVWAWYDGTRYKGPSTAAGVGSRGLERTQNMLVQAVDAFREMEEEQGSSWPDARSRPGLLLERVPHSPESTMEVADETPEGEGYIQNWRKLTTVEPEPAAGDAEPGYVDPVRVFFKLRVEDIGELIPCAVKVVKNVVGSFENSNNWPTAAIEAARLVLVSAFLQNEVIDSYYLGLARVCATVSQAETRIIRPEF